MDEQQRSAGSAGAAEPRDSRGRDTQDDEELLSMQELLEAEEAAVRIAVMYPPSITARGRPSVSENTAISAWCDGSPRAWLPGNTDTSFTSMPAPGMNPGITATTPAADPAATRGGAEAEPELKAMKPSASASTSRCTSSSRSTSSRGNHTMSMSAMDYT